MDIISWSRAFRYGPEAVAGDKFGHRHRLRALLSAIYTRPDNQ
jgi:hypothetical protein